ncbi:hypothetical protein BRC83_09830 [Halobacteriales archaeon QS_1_68_17]|nr:MAG: hypothetical protein BRC83_09830 [Halobacteriales archaeon QS_1_68_17]
MYRAANLPVSFEVFLARVYGLSWVVLACVLVWTGVLGFALPEGTFEAVWSFLGAGLPGADRIPLPAIPRSYSVVVVAVVAALAAKRLTVALGGQYLRWVAAARRADIESTLPGAVRYLRVLATGGDDREAMLRRVAAQDAYGETAVAFRRALNGAALTGSLDAGLERVARDTPSSDLLTPFLLKFREHANQGTDALEGYLQLEGRMLSHRQDRLRERTSGYLELLAELFVVLLVLPALLVLILTVMSVLAPELSTPVETPLGTIPVRVVIVYASAAFALAVGGLAASLVSALKPGDYVLSTYTRPGGIIGVFSSAPSNPASAAVVMPVVALPVAIWLWQAGYTPENVVLLAYVAYGLPVGVVSLRRAQLDEAKDREIKDFVHAVSGHVSLGRPLPDAVESVAREVELGALQADVDALAFELGLTTGDAGGDGSRDVQAAALDQFVGRVGTPLAEQTIGLVTGALDAGSDPENVFETLQAEVGRLYDKRKSLRSSLLIYVAIGWTTALIVVGIVVAVNVYVLDGFAQLSAVSGTGIAIQPDAVQPARDGRRFYVVTQATMLACGWFAGTASRGRYEALLHSAALVGIAYVVFAGMGVV